MASILRGGAVEDSREKVLFSLFEMTTFARSSFRFYDSLILRDALENEF